MIANLDSIALELARRERRVLPAAERGRAGVMVALYGHGPDYRVLYTVRTLRVEHHKGEISFPGGGCDPEDGTVIQTALRESFEEVGIQVDHMNVLGLLDDLVTNSRFTVTPVLARVEVHPYRFNPHPAEVDSILEVPLSHLLHPANQEDDPRGRALGTPSYRFGHHVIWGATAKMTTEFLNILHGQ